MLVGQLCRPAVQASCAGQLCRPAVQASCAGQLCRPAVQRRRARLGSSAAHLSRIHQEPEHPLRARARACSVPRLRQPPAGSDQQCEHGRGIMRLCTTVPRRLHSVPPEPSTPGCLRPGGHHGSDALRSRRLPRAGRSIKPGFQRPVGASPAWCRGRRAAAAAAAAAAAEWVPTAVWDHLQSLRPRCTPVPRPPALPKDEWARALHAAAAGRALLFLERGERQRRRVERRQQVRRAAVAQRREASMQRQAREAPAQPCAVAQVSG